MLGNEGSKRAAFLDIDKQAPNVVPVSLPLGAPRSSLFESRGVGFFEPFNRDDGPLALQGSGIVALRNLIAKAEAGPLQYDAVQYGARIKPGKRPTEMTVGEIYQWIDATPGQPHAIGRYQFIPPTLRRLVRALGVSENARFSPLLQDRLADLLLEEAGLSAFLTGQMYQTEFMNNLAKIWAGLPNSSGKSHYHGYAGNKATMSWSTFQAKMDLAFPRG